MLCLLFYFEPMDELVIHGDTIQIQESDKSYKTIACKLKSDLQPWQSVFGKTTIDSQNKSLRDCIIKWKIKCSGESKTFLPFTVGILAMKADKDEDKDDHESCLPDPNKYCFYSRSNEDYKYYAFAVVVSPLSTIDLEYRDSNCECDRLTFGNQLKNRDLTGDAEYIIEMMLDLKNRTIKWMMNGVMLEEHVKNVDMTQRLL